MTILLRAGSKRLLDEYHRSVLDVIAVIRDFIVKPSIVGGRRIPQKCLLRPMLEKRLVLLAGESKLLYRNLLRH